MKTMTVNLILLIEGATMVFTKEKHFLPLPNGSNYRIQNGVNFINTKSTLTITEQDVGEDFALLTLESQEFWVNADTTSNILKRKGWVYLGFQV